MPTAAPQAPEYAPGEIQLDPRQKSVTPSTHDSPDQQYRFRHSPELRAHWLRYLPAFEPSPAKISRFNACGSKAYVEYSRNADAFRLRADHCGNRVCPACQRAYAFKLTRRLTELFTHSRSNPPLFITLTLRPSAAPLPDIIRNLKAFFRRLRATPLWKEAVRYGVAVVEVTRGKRGDHWHAHLHCVAWSKYLDARKLSAIWRKITSGSFIVDVQRVKTSDDVASYVSSYLTKPPDDAVLQSVSNSQEWYQASTRQHWVIRFGSRKLLPPRTEPQRFHDWIVVCSLGELLAAAGDLPLKAAARQVFGKRIAAAETELLRRAIDTT